MEKLTETIADDDYRNEDGLLVCGRCGTPKEMRLSTELLGGHTAIVPIPCECMKRAEAERRERELAAERKRKIERERTECFAGCAFFRGCTFDADDGRTPQIAAICKGYADTFSRDDMNGLLLWGKVGTGKSFYASAIANRVIDLGFSALQTSVQDIVTHIESVPFNDREQARKWKAATLAAIGETVLKTLGADWTAIDLEGLQGWFADNAEDIRLMAVTDPRTPVEAKEALDAFKRSSKPKRTGKPDAVEDVTEMPETIDMAEDEKQADW